MSLLIARVSVPPIFPGPNRPITMGRVGEFRRMVDRNNRSMQEASGSGHQTRYISNMQNQFSMVKSRIDHKIDLIA